MAKEKSTIAQIIHFTLSISVLLTLYHMIHLTCFDMKYNGIVIFNLLRVNIIALMSAYCFSGDEPEILCGGRGILSISDLQKGNRPTGRGWESM